MEKFRTIQNLKHLCKDRRQHGRQTIRVDGNGSFKENCGVYAVRLFLRMDTWMTLLIAFKPTRKPKLLQRKSTKHWKSVAFGSKNGLYQDHPSWRSSRVPSKARKEIMRNLKGGLEIPLSRRIFAHNTPRNCLRFMFTPSLPNHAGWQFDLSRKNAVIFIQFPFSRSEIYPITPSRFPLGGPLKEFLAFNGTLKEICSNFVCFCRMQYQPHLQNVSSYLRSTVYIVERIRAVVVQIFNKEDFSLIFLS